MDVSSIALQGMQAAQAQLQTTAQRLASLTPGPDSAGVSDAVDLSAAAVSMLTAKHQFAANAGVVKVADQMQKSLLNLLA